MIRKIIKILLYPFYRCHIPFEARASKDESELDKRLKWRYGTSEMCEDYQYYPLSDEKYCFFYESFDFNCYNCQWYKKNLG